MKITIISICLFLAMRSTTALAGNPINVPVKVSELFHHSFPDVKNENWYKIQNSYEVYFKNRDGACCKVFYSPKGKLLYTFKYSSGSDLPLFIKTELAEKYQGEKVFSVTEVHSDNATFYHMILEDNKRLYEVDANANGFITSAETFTRAK